MTALPRRLAFGGVAVVHLAALATGRPRLAAATKLLAVPALACDGVARPAAVASALAASWLGDNGGAVYARLTRRPGEPTDPDAPVSLAIMMGGFAAAHVAYTLALRRAAGADRPTPLSAAGYGTLGAGIVAACWSGAGALRPLLLGYAALLATMAAAASAAGPRATAGAGAFVASDALLALRLFRGVRVPDTAVMALYLAAQWLLAGAVPRAATR